MSEVANLKVRKDLSRWSRKLLLSIGLEDIGKHIVGEEKWKALYPLWKAEADDKPPSDFDPNEVHEDEDHNGVQDGETAETMSQADPSETPPPIDEPEERKSELIENFFQNLLPYWYLFNRAFPNPSLLNNISNVSEEDLSSATNPTELMESLDGNQQLNSLILFESLKRQYAAQMGLPTGLHSFSQFPPSGPLYSSELLEQMMAANGSHAKLDNQHQPSARGNSSVGSNHGDEPDEGEQPLDLTQKRTENGSHNIPAWPEVTSTIRPSPVDDLKSAKNLPRLSVRSGKGYTSQELEAALRDIQSGKLGTRRAAVIYGIPRSTLRNKVYKLGKDRSRPFLRQKPVSPGKSSESPPNPYSLAELAGSDHHFNQKSSIAHQIGHSISSNTNSPGLLSCLRRDPEPANMDENNHAQDSEEEVSNAKYDDEISHEKQVLKNWLRSRLSKQPGVDSQLLDGRYPCKRETSHNNNNNNHSSRHVGPPTDHMSDSSENSDLSRQDSTKDVILKIPSVSNNQSSLKKMISLKRSKRESSLDDNDEIDGTADSSMPNSETYGIDHLPTSSILNSGLLFGSQLAWKGTKHFKADSDHLEHNGITIKPTSKATTQKQDMFHQHWGFNKDSPPASMMSSTSNSSSTGGQDANGKKSRPKRGKYRNYDRDALLQAVKAVQNGEMSVHRAGSFYGVPHSTLEYKVKERHLLRRPKRKTAESPQLNHKSSPDSSMSGSEPASKSTSISHQQQSDIKPNLPAAPDIRDSISRYLNASSSGNLARALAGAERNASPSTLSNAVGKCSEDLHHSENNHPSYGLPRGVAPYLDMINLNDLIRKNLDPAALLDLTKKS